MPKTWMLPVPLAYETGWRMLLFDMFGPFVTPRAACAVAGAKPQFPADISGGHFRRTVANYSLPKCKLRIFAKTLL